MNKILVIGNGGYVGSVLVSVLQQKDSYDVHGQDVLWFGAINSSTVLPEAFLTSHTYKDLRDIVVSDLESFETVIILSAVSNDPMGNKFENVTIEINKDATLKVASLAQTAGVKRLVFASSCSVYGLSDDKPRKEGDLLNPLTTYAKSKILVEEGLKALASKDFTITCLRFATAAGASPRLRLDLVLNDFVASAVLKNYIEILSDGTPWRPIIHTEDMARSFVWAIERKPRSEQQNFLTVNIGSDDWTFTMKSLAEEVSNALGGTKVIINPEGKPDPRSYKVNFSLFKELAPDYQPVKSIKDAVRELAEQIKYFKVNEDFRSSYWIRLNHLNSLIDKGLLDKKLRWRRK